MAIIIEKIKQLRQETGFSLAECKNAMEEAGGDIEKAKKILNQKETKIAGKRSERATKQGIITSYIHSNKKVGVLLDLRCETDFVARGEEFNNLAHELCLQIAAMKPIYVKAEDIPEEFVDGETKIYKEQFKDSGKPQKIIDQIIEGKLNKYKEEVSLMSQLWIKDDTKTIKDLINQYIAKIGENIVINKFNYYEVI
ncbi:MAG: translation elongation factor Ts [Candidatus Parcubacteria bacterium]|nr:translation elongation factor Ts [Candidatus Parcubacteria bacterium]